MVIRVNFESDEALYIQLRNQIVLGIATSLLREGDPLPSVRQLAESIGINMHTVNKAYSTLKAEGFLTVNRRGAFVSLNDDHDRAYALLREELKIALASASARNITVDEVHGLIDDIMKDYKNR